MQFTGRLAAGLVGLVLLAGCAEQRAERRIAEAKAEQKSQDAACNTQFPEKIGNYRSRAYCLSDALVAFNNRAHSGDDSDMLAVFSATRISLAGKVDRGEMSADDMELQLASLWSEQATQITRRNTQSAAARAAVLIPMMQMQQQQQFQQQQAQQQMYQQQMNAIRASTFQPNPTVNCSSNMFGNMVSTTCN